MNGFRLGGNGLLTGYTYVLKEKHSRYIQSRLDGCITGAQVGGLPTHTMIHPSMDKTGSVLSSWMVSQTMFHMNAPRGS